MSHISQNEFETVNWLPIKERMASLGFIGPPKFRFPLDAKAPCPPLIYLVGLLAILDPHVNICVRPSNTCVASKQFNLYPLTHCFEAISFITP